MLLLVKMQDSACKVTKSNTSPWVFFTFLKLCKMVLNRVKRLIYSKAVGRQLKEQLFFKNSLRD